MRANVLNSLQLDVELSQESDVGPRLLAVAVLERAVWDLSGVGSKNRKRDVVDARHWIFSDCKKCRAARLFWCSFLNDEPEVLEAIIQKVARQVLSGEIQKKPKALSVRTGRYEVKAA